MAWLVLPAGGIEWTNSESAGHGTGIVEHQRNAQARFRSPCGHGGTVDLQVIEPKDAQESGIHRSAAVKHDRGTAWCIVHRQLRRLGVRTGELRVEQALAEC